MRLSQVVRQAGPEFTMKSSQGRVHRVKFEKEGGKVKVILDGHPMPDLFPNEESARKETQNTINLLRPHFGY